MASWLEGMLGAEVQAAKGTVKTAQIASDCDLIGIYFSAHWCPPCKGFTPKLAAWYKKGINDLGKKFDIIFASSDKDQKAFDGYYAEMPWKAVPYKERKLKEKLSKKYGVSGIPTLVMLDPKTGAVHSKAGRGLVDKDPDFKEFPWTPKTWAETLGDSQVVTKDDAKSSLKDLTEKEYIALYFSAHWCPPCRTFTPKLAKWYEEYHKDDSNWEMVFVSWDKTESDYDEYRKTMPFPSRTWDDKALREALDDKYEVGGIPTLMVVEAKTGKVVSADGRAGVDGEPAGFPWEKKPVCKLGSNCIDALNGAQCMLAFVDSAASVADITKAMDGEAGKFADKLKATGDWPGVMDVEFIVDNGSDGLSERVRGLIKRTDAEILCVMSLGDKTLWNHTGVKSAADIDAAKVEALVKAASGEKVDGVTSRPIDI